MSKIYIRAPYKKEYKIKIEHIRNVANHIYAKLEEDAAFYGNNKVSGDIFSVDDMPCHFLKNTNNEYIEISDSSKSNIEIKINWQERLKNMQGNLGLAIFRAYIEKTSSYAVQNYRVKGKELYVDIGAKDIAFVTLKNLEELSNYLITANLDVENRDGTIFIDSIGEIEYSGPALKRTGEVGLILVNDIEKTLNGLRIHLLAGTNALKTFRENIALLNNIKSYLNVSSREEIFPAIKKLK
ncbi:hypothetical protein [Peptoniphilus raoultii]|uniref:hypothetical protein n=1 Tax=Peptoniphilus raoultii TaxID=1776387 RepID=UPI0008DAD633|nr:hypothetical protein [Peptoniphilus raoultii]